MFLFLNVIMLHPFRTRVPRRLVSDADAVTIPVMLMITMALYSYSPTPRLVRGLVGWVWSQGVMVVLLFTPSTGIVLFTMPLIAYRASNYHKSALSTGLFECRYRASIVVIERCTGTQVPVRPLGQPTEKNASVNFREQLIDPWIRMPILKVLECSSLGKG